MVKKSFVTCNWQRMKEPRDVRMVIGMLIEVGIGSQPRSCSTQHVILELMALLQGVIACLQRSMHIWIRSLQRPCAHNNCYGPLPALDHRFFIKCALRAAWGLVPGAYEYGERGGAIDS